VGVLHLERSGARQCRFSKALQLDPSLRADMQKEIGNIDERHRQEDAARGTVQKLASYFVEKNARTEGECAQLQMLLDSGRVPLFQRLESRARVSDGASDEINPALGVSGHRAGPASTAGAILRRRRSRWTLPTRWCLSDDSKTPTGVAEAPLTDISVEAFSSQVETCRPRPVAVPQRRQPNRAPDRVQEGLGNRSCAQVFAFPSIK